MKATFKRKCELCGIFFLVNNINDLNRVYCKKCRKKNVY